MKPTDERIHELEQALGLTAEKLDLAINAAECFAQGVSKLEATSGEFMNSMLKAMLKSNVQLCKEQLLAAQNILAGVKPDPNDLQQQLKEMGSLVRHLIYAPDIDAVRRYRDSKHVEAQLAKAERGGVDEQHE